MMNPISKLRKLLRLKTNAEVAETFDLNISTANSINTGRGSQNLQNAYEYIAYLLERLTWKERQKLAPFKRPELEPPDQAALKQELREKLPQYPATIQEQVESLQELVNQYTTDIETFSKLPSRF